MSRDTKIFLDKSEKHAITHGIPDTLPPIRERWLEDVMTEIARTGRPPAVEIPRSVSFYTRSLIRERFGIVLTVNEVQRMLAEEGLLTP